ncbi:MAG: protein kinase [Ktedonobacteraceae bacterium]
MLAADRTGQMLRNYRVLRLLRSGRLADVYLAQHTDLKTQVVLKVFHTPLSQQDQQLFLAQAQAIAHLTHPNIVQMLDFDVENAFGFLVMTYVPEKTLRQLYPPRSRLSVSQVVPLVTQLAAALSYAHNRNVVHQDIKPENMFLRRNGKVLLTDFAIPIIFSQTFAHGKAGSSTAPEQAGSEASPAGDQYALAGVVYEWLTGQRFVPPEMGDQPTAAAPVSVQKTPVTLPPLVADVLQTALKSDPQQRFKSVAAFATALEQANAEHQGLPVVPARPDAITQTQPPSPHTESTPGAQEPIYLPPVPEPQKEPEPLASLGQPAATPEPVEKSSPAKSPQRVLVPVLLALLLLLGLLAGGLFLATHTAHTPAGSVGTKQQQQATPVAPSTLTPVPTATPLPTATPTPLVGVVYQADWTRGWPGRGSHDWSVSNNELVNNGSSYSGKPDPTIVAPYTMTATPDYAVETRVRATAIWPCFDISLRGAATPAGWQGYKAAVCDQKIRLQAGNTILATVPFTPGTPWHTYRFAVKGSHLTFSVDGQPLAQTDDTRYRSGGQVGLKSYGTRLEISSLKVLAL